MIDLQYFELSEFDCQETGENEMDEDFLQSLDYLRELCGFPFVITSGYRSPNHSIEKAKTTPGTHAQGVAVDIKVDNGAQRMRVVEEAINIGFSGIGVAKGFVHVDARKTTPVMWTY